ncbi:MAG: hypothetical protein SPJ84_00445 [Fusobacterium gastrosuis]|nr:hypothetical protein [Fusobacterium gastrosuis]
MKETILVTGGVGLLKSCCHELLRIEYKVVVIDSMEKVIKNNSINI